MLDPSQKLPLLSNNLEKIVAQLKAFLVKHHILELFNSNFKKLPSREFTLFRVFINFLLANDSWRLQICPCLVPLEQTECWPQYLIGLVTAPWGHTVSSRSLNWLRSYLEHRTDEERLWSWDFWCSIRFIFIDLVFVFLNYVQLNCHVFTCSTLFRVCVLKVLFNEWMNELWLLFFN